MNNHLIKQLYAQKTTRQRLYNYHHRIDFGFGHNNFVSVKSIFKCY